MIDWRPATDLPDDLLTEAIEEVNAIAPAVPPMSLPRRRSEQELAYQRSLANVWSESDRARRLAEVRGGPRRVVRLPSSGTELPEEVVIASLRGETIVQWCLRVGAVRL